jgi:signal transduction histidine kinase
VVSRRDPRERVAGVAAALIARLPFGADFPTSRDAARASRVVRTPIGESAMGLGVGGSTVELADLGRWLGRLVALFQRRPVEAPPAPAVALREEALTEAAFVLAATPTDGRLDPLLRFASQAAARIADASAALVVLNGDGSVERFAADGADGCMRDTLARPAVLAAITRRFREGARTVQLDDLDEPVARLLRAVAPRGFLALPLGLAADAMLIVMEPANGAGFDREIVTAANTLALLTGAALDGARRLGSLRDACDDLHGFVEHLLARRDQELGRTARGLHEGIGQWLAAANAQLEAVEELLPPTGIAARARLHDARVLLERTLGELRELAQELRPSVLEDFGYVQALRWYVGRLRGRVSAPVSLEVEGAETRLPRDLEGALFRATEEALGAALCDDNDAPVRVRYRRDGHGVRIEIVGRSPERLSLVAIRERLRPFGGAVHASGESASLAVELPVT